MQWLNRSFLTQLASFLGIIAISIILLVVVGRYQTDLQANLLKAGALIVEAFR